MGLSLPSSLRRLLPARSVDRLRRFIWSLPNLRRELRSGTRIVVANPSDWMLYNDIFVDGEYDAAIDLTLDLARRDGVETLTVVDLGANVGFFTLRAAERIAASARRARFVLAEASRDTAAELDRRLAEQPHLADAVTLLRGLVGRRQGSGTIFVSPLHAESSVVRRPGVTRQDVDYIDLEAALAGAERIDLLKCDIEGSELEFLASYPELLRRTHVCVIEVHPELCDPRRCLDLLAAAGLDETRCLREATAATVILLTRSSSPPIEPGPPGGGGR